MGIGKTIQIIALILTSPAPKAVNRPPLTPRKLVPQNRFAFGFKPNTQESEKFNTDNSSFGNVPSRSTLIICPLSTVCNWEDQIASHSQANSLSVYIYHGPSREQNPAILASYDVVITTYNILAIAMSTKKRSTYSPLHDIYWYRIVLV